jgi:hypothetical protein
MSKASPHKRLLLVPSCHSVFRGFDLPQARSMAVGRRQLLEAALGFGLGMIAGPASPAAPQTYEEAVRSARAPLQDTPRDRELVRFATLAASSHNTQPWTFTTAASKIIIVPDFERRCPAVDPDDHHLFISLGCAAENLVVAASAVGLNATPVVDGDRIVVHLEPAPRGAD